jgi:hypothetical protein
LVLCAGLGLGCAVIDSIGLSVYAYAGNCFFLTYPLGACTLAVAVAVRFFWRVCSTAFFFQATWPLLFILSFKMPEYYHIHSPSGDYHLNLQVKVGSGQLRDIYTQPVAAFVVATSGFTLLATGIVQAVTGSSLMHGLPGVD